MPGWAENIEVRMVWVGVHFGMGDPSGRCFLCQSCSWKAFIGAGTEGVNGCSEG